LVTAFEDRAAILCYPAFDKNGAEVNIDFLPDFSVGFSRLVPKELLGREIPELLKVIHWYINDKVVPPLKPYLEKIGE
jgi:protein-tyrosine phosphatase